MRRNTCARCGKPLLHTTAINGHICGACRSRQTCESPEVRDLIAHVSVELKAKRDEQLLEELCQSIIVQAFDDKTKEEILRNGWID